MSDELDEKDIPTQLQRDLTTLQEGINNRARAQARDEWIAHLDKLNAIVYACGWESELSSLEIGNKTVKLRYLLRLFRDQFMAYRTEELARDFAEEIVKNVL